MKTVTTALALTATLAASAFAGSASAQSYRGYAEPYRSDCQVQTHNNGTAGAVIGGLLGAVIGSNVAAHNARDGGAVLGALAGAAIGNNIARSSTKTSCETAYYGDSRYAYDNRGDRHDNRYGYDRDRRHGSGYGYGYGYEQPYRGR